MKKNLVFLIFILFSFSAYAADDDSNPCSGPLAFINIIDRPSFADSVCSVPALHFIAESGFQYQSLMDDQGIGKNYPNLEVRYGLFKNTEFYAFLPDYIDQTPIPHYGSTETTAGLKHSFSFKSWLFAMEAAVDFPDGSYEFGSSNYGVIANFIAAYGLTDKLGINLMLGGSSLTVSRFSGGNRFNSFNTDILFGYLITPKIEFFGEIYDQSKTGPGQASGAIADCGLLFLIKPEIVVDINAGQRVYGFPGSYNHYVGAGISFIL